MSPDTGDVTDAEPDIAVVAMAGRFPGAPSVQDFWELLRTGRDAIRPVGDGDFLAAGGAPARLADPNHVRVECVLDGMDLFDAEFFGIQPAEAELLDPQHRVFIETAYHVLEQAGYVSGGHEGTVGVYAGASQSQYYLDHVYPSLAHRPGTIDGFIGAVANAGSALATRVSYLLNLTGPSVAVQTACSTSLVAVHLACQDLLNHQCDAALAGGSTVNPAARLGYQYVPGGPFSPDGHCRPYSVDAAGMSPGDGVGVVLLKRLADALADGDHIRAVIKGSAVNNDGSRKIGFTAPSVQGQRDVIVAAQAMAGITADAIGYVEGHGTATPVGDPIEVSALTKAFASSTDRKGFCALGSVKSNLGHLDAAAGIAGFIKTVLALENEAIPATLHFAGPNELIDFEASPFVVADSFQDWKRSATPRFAAVSSFGVGGTNAHLVLAEAPPRTPVKPSGRPEIVLLSAAGPGALTDLGTRLGEHTAQHSGTDVADIAHTLQRGRRPMRSRRALVAESATELAEALAVPAAGVHGEAGGRPRDVVFLYPGGGSQYQRMGQRLYENHEVYRREMDRCARIVASVSELDLLAALYPPGDAAPRRDKIDVTVGPYPAIVATEWALTALLASWGIRPAMMIGHSLGEYTAACVAGVLELEEMLPLVMERERLLRKAGGLTLSVLLDEADIGPHLLPGTSLAGVNAPGMCTVSGVPEAILQLEKSLLEQGIDQHRLRLPGGAHSVALDPVLDELREVLGRVTLREPTIPVLSGLTGEPLTAAQARDPEHWVRHTREPVRFRDCLEALPTDPAPVLLEAGPSAGLVKLAQYTLGDRAIAVPGVRHAYAEESDQRVLLNAVGRLWANGVDVDWAAAREGRPGRTVPLPEYPFQRRRFWVDRVDRAAEPPPAEGDAVEFTARVWSGSGLPRPASGPPALPGGSAAPGSASSGAWAAGSASSGASGASTDSDSDTVVVLLGRTGDGESPADERPAVPPSVDGARWVPIRFADGAVAPRRDSYLLDPADPADLRALCAHLWPDGAADAWVRILDLTSATGRSDPTRAVTDTGLFVDGLLTALGERDRPVRLVTVGHTAYGLTGTPATPEHRLAHGVVSRWRYEGSPVDATAVDLGEPLSMNTTDTGSPTDTGATTDTGWRLLADELRATGTAAETVAHRGGHRWLVGTVTVPATAPVPDPPAHGWIVPDGLRAPTLPYATFLSTAFDGAVTVGGTATPADGARPGLLRVLHHGPDSGTPAVPDWLTELWRHRAGQSFGAIVLIDPVPDRPSVGRAAVSSFAEACVEAAAAEGLPWRLLRWRDGPTGAPLDDETWEADVRRGADALATALGTTGHPVLTLTVPGMTKGAGRAPADDGTGPGAPEADEPPRPQDNGRARPPLSTPYAKPRNGMEQRVVDIWREALGLDDIGVDDNFFELGGESLLLMRVIAKLRERFAVNMSIRQLYINDRLTVSGMATVLEERTT